MNEELLRAMVREAVARHLGGETNASHREVPMAATLSSHASHYRYSLPESDGPCVIEPGVRCNHCGYCQSHGH